MEEAIKYLLVPIEALREHTPHLQPYEIHLFLTPHRLVSVSTGKQTKILFLGNSYTAQSARFIKEVFNRDGGSYELQFGTPGERSQFPSHQPNQSTSSKSAKWDFVVIQDQSQKPGLGGPYTEGFMRGERTMRGHRKTRRQTCLFMTWGRRDGDKRNTQIYPDFITMHGKISSSYKKAAEENRVLLVRSDGIFAIVLGQDKALFRKLYKSDEATLERRSLFGRLVLWGTLTGKNPSSIRWNGS